MYIFLLEYFIYKQNYRLQTIEFSTLPIKEHKVPY